MRPSNILIILFICLSMLTFFEPANAGQDQVDTSKETKESISTKLNICLSSNVLNINNYKNLQVLYANLLNEKKVLEQRLKTLEDTQKETDLTKNLEQEKQKAIAETQEYKKTARYVLYFLIGALMSLGLNRYFSTKAKYYLVAEKNSLAKFFGMLGFIFLGVLLISIILFLYFLLKLVF